MKYKMLYLLISIMLCVTISACSQQEETPADEAMTDRISIAESEMPANTLEHQGYVEKYMYPFVTSGLFSKEFSPNDMSAFEQMNPTDFGYLYLNYDPSNSLKISDEDSEIDGDMLESIMMSYLPFTSEQIRAAYAEYYDADRHVYSAAFGGLGGGPAEFIITDSRLENGVLFLHYDLYGGDYDALPWPDDEFHWVLKQQGQLQIEVDGEHFKFISNTVQ